MKPFQYVNASDESAAFAALARPGAVAIAGGTALLDLMKLDVQAPPVLVDINQLQWRKIEASGTGVRIGALALNVDVANAPLVRSRCPLLSEAILAGASPQIRNMATVGGNLLQRTRCNYFRDATVMACNKRRPTSGCAALEGVSRDHAILGTSSQCIAAHPSDMAVALAALDAEVILRSANGERKVPIEDFYTLPGDHPEKETVLRPGELLVAVDVPLLSAKSRYLKVRDRASYAFALVSAAVAIEVNAGIVRFARIALGGVGTRPWRCRTAETKLIGEQASQDLFEQAAAAAIADARPRRGNLFKVELARRTVAHALARLVP